VPVPEPDLSQLRNVLNVRRHEAGLTFEQLAEQSGVSRQTLLNISAGRYNGDLRTWLRLCKTFRVGLDDLLAPVWTPDRDCPSNPGASAGLERQ
jgi:putative transcriptional regulator